MEKALVFDFTKDSTVVGSMSNFASNISSIIKCPSFLGTILCDTATSDNAPSNGVGQHNNDGHHKKLVKTPYQLESDFKLAFLSNNSY